MNRKLIRNLVSAVAVVTLGATLAVASPGEGGAGREGRRHRGGEFGKKVADKLNLSDAQREQIRESNRTFRDQNFDFFQSVRQSRHELRQAMQAGDTAKVETLKAAMQSQREKLQSLREAHRQSLDSVLTPDQRAQIEQFRSQREERHERRQK